MDSYPPEAWQRLGSVLASRRGQLGYGFRQRAAFAEASAFRLSARTLQRLEQAERDAYPEETLAVAEAIYRLEPGSIVRVLRGGDAKFLEQEPADDRPEIVRASWHVDGVPEIWGVTALRPDVRAGLVDALLERIARQEPPAAAAG